MRGTQSFTSPKRQRGRNHPLVSIGIDRRANLFPDRPVWYARHGRFSATRRHYSYCIVTRRAPLALERGRAWWLPIPLAAEAMDSAAQLLVGRHDFTTFRAADCQAKSPVKTLDRLDVARIGDAIEIRAAARSFLHHQVRSMVGSLKLVGEGKWRMQDIADALAAADRCRCGPVAPAHGLYLVQVDY